MHNLPSQELVTRFRCAALLLLFNQLLIPVALALLVYSLVISEPNLTHLALALIVFSVLIMIVQAIIASRARCPLCIGLPLRNNACVKHRDARSVCGSYCLGVALTVVFRGDFRCPYCGELTAVRVRQRRHRQRGGNNRT